MKTLKIFGIVLVLAAGVFTASASGSDAEESVKECICLHIYEPVCIIETGQQFSNDCEARCAGYLPEDWYDCWRM